MGAPPPADDRRARPAAVSPGQVALAAAALLFCVWISFRGALSAGFVSWDDPLNFVHNPGFRGFSRDHLAWMFTTLHVGHWMPLTWLSCALDHALFGLDPRAFHRTNVLLHAANALWVLALLGALLERRAAGLAPRARLLAAGAGAFLFAVHPLRAESVAWATERRDVLAGFFLFASAFCYVRGLRDGRLGGRALALAVLAYALSLMSKAMGLTFPFVLLALDLWLGRARAGPGRGARARRLALEKLPFLALAALAAGVALAGQARGTDELATLGEFSLAQRVVHALRGLLFYPWKTLAPAGLSPLYELDRTADPFAAPFLAAAAGALAVAALLVLLRRRWPAGLASFAIYAIVISPLLGLVQTGVQDVADRYSYLACVPFAGLLGAGLAWLWQRAAAAGRAQGAAVLGTAALLAAGLCALTSAQVAIWRDSIALWTRAVEVEPEGWIARTNLAVALHQARRSQEALEHYDALARRAAAESPKRRADLHYNRALAYLALGRYGEAQADLEAALAAAPAHVGALRAILDFDRAGIGFEGHLERWRRARAGFAGSPAERLVLELEFAGLASQSGLEDQARRALDELAALFPGDARVHHARGVFLLQANEPSTAREELQLAVRIDPLQAVYRTHLGLAHRALGEQAQARAAWERALELDPSAEPPRRYLDAPAGS